MALERYSFRLKDGKNRLTNSFAKAKSYAVFKDNKKILGYLKFSEQRKTVKQKSLFIEQIFTYILIRDEDLASDKRRSRREQSLQRKLDRYGLYVKDVEDSITINNKKVSIALFGKNKKSTSSVTTAKFYAIVFNKKHYAKLEAFPKGLSTKQKREKFLYQVLANHKPFFTSTDMMISQEEEKLKSRGIKVKKWRLKARTRFSYWQIPVLTRSKLYTKYLRYRVIISRALGEKTHEELETYVQLKKPIIFESGESMTEPSNILYKVIKPHFLKLHRQLMNGSKKEYGVIFRLLYDFQGSLKKNYVQGYSHARGGSKRVEFGLSHLKDTIREATGRGVTKNGGWVNYMKYVDEEAVVVTGFNIQVTKRTNHRSSDSLNIGDIK